MENSCVIYGNKESDINRASEDIHNNKLVIFPTETVYGLGANALSDDAVKKIFDIKRRNLSNPLIVHCLGIYDSLTICNLNNVENVIFKQLAKSFWPGPLTMVVKSKGIVSKLVTADSNFVGVRVPNNRTTLSFIRKCGVPIAAPSANISGKTSSTTLEHIKNYFNNKNISIINDENYICKYGIESTIIKIEDNNITILRPGIITKNDLQNNFNKTKLNVNISYKNELSKIVNSPGQDVSHYCPDKPVYILNILDININPGDQTLYNEIHSKTEKLLQHIILIDFNSLCYKFRKKFLGYVDLSNNGDFKEALFNIYNVFHQINSLDCDKIYIFNFKFIEDELNITLWDRLWRAAEGKEIAIPKCLLV